MAELPEGWAAKTSSSTGRTYYLNEYTKATQWEKPEPVPPGQVSLLASSGPFSSPQEAWGRDLEDTRSLSKSGIIITKEGVWKIHLVFDLFNAGPCISSACEAREISSSFLLETGEDHTLL